MLWYTPKDILRLHESIQDGDIFIYHKVGNWWNSMGAKLIQFGSGGPFNHTDIVFHKNGELWVIFADSVKGIVERKWEDVYGKSPNYIMILRPTVLSNGKKYTVADGKHVVEIDKTYLGRKYDTTALLVFFFKAIGLGIFNKWNPFQIRNRYFCSENVVTVEREAGVEICPDYTPASVSINQMFLDTNNKLDIVILQDEVSGVSKTAMKKIKKQYLPENREILYNDFSNEVKNHSKGLR